MKQQRQPPPWVLQKSVLPWAWLLQASPSTMKRQVLRPPWTLQKPFLFWDRLSQASPSTMKLQSLPPPCLIPTPRKGVNRSDFEMPSGLMPHFTEG